VSAFISVHGKILYYERGFGWKRTNLRLSWLNCSRTRVIGGSGKSLRFVLAWCLRLCTKPSPESFSDTGFVKLGAGDHTLPVDCCRLRFCMSMICRNEFNAASNFGLIAPPSRRVVFRTASATRMGKKYVSLTGSLSCRTSENNGGKTSSSTLRRKHTVVQVVQRLEENLLGQDIKKPGLQNSEANAV
jgi:hypothetical protein